MGMPVEVPVPRNVRENMDWVSKHGKRGGAGGFSAGCGEARRLLDSVRRAGIVGAILTPF
jgi:hypothetical protein